MQVSASSRTHYFKNMASSSAADNSVSPSSQKLAWVPQLAPEPEQDTDGGAQRVNNARQWAFPSANESAVAKAAHQSAILHDGRIQLMKSLYEFYDPSLKTSFGHSLQNLRYAEQEINDRLSTGKLFDGDIADLCLLTKYIESDYKRVTSPAPPAHERQAARQAASEALSRLGHCLIARKMDLIAPAMTVSETDFNISPPTLLTLAKTWLQALGVMVQKHPTGGYVEKNYKTLKMLMTHFLASEQFQRMSDYESSNCFIALCNLINSVRSNSRDDRFLDTKQKRLRTFIKQTIQKSLAFAAKKSSPDIYALDHLRRAMDAYIAMSVRMIRYSNAQDKHSLLTPFFNKQLTHLLKNYKDLDEKNPLREEIRMVLGKYVTDTGQKLDKLSDKNFHGLFKPIDEGTLVPHKTPLSTGGELQSQLALSPPEREGIRRALEKTFAKFVDMFGDKTVKDYASKPLRIVVFKDRKQYVCYGYYPFRIDTNNGGLFLKGEPSDPNNQPSIYAYYQKGKILNLCHEFVHFLDGKYINYGNSAYISSEWVTFWQEGLAQYLSGQGEDYAAAVLRRAPDGQRPSLAQIVDIDSYSVNGHSDRLYVWPYYVFKYFNSTPETRNIMGTLANALGKSDKGDTYKRRLTEFVTAHADRFKAWLDTEASIAKAARDGVTAPCAAAVTRA